MSDLEEDGGGGGDLGEGNFQKLNGGEEYGPRDVEMTSLRRVDSTEALNLTLHQVNYFMHRVTYRYEVREGQ